MYEDPAAKEKESEEMRVLAGEGVNELSPKIREIMLLHYFENFTYQEMSDILQIPMGTVSIRLSRAREALKKRMLPKIEKHYE